MNPALTEIIDGLEPLERVRWDALAEGSVQFQRGKACANAWLPAREDCPACLASEWEWEKASGKATLNSWVVYNRAFSAAFKDQVPYAIALVQLEEGPSMITRMQAVVEGATPACGDPVVVSTVEVDGMRIADARPVGD